MAEHQGRISSGRKPKPLATGDTVFGNFEIVGRLGSGGMGVVYRAMNTVLQREVALKVLPEGCLHSDKLLRFQNEARILGKFDHRCIAKIYDFNIFDGTPYLVMDLVEGQTLEHVVSSAGPLSVDDFIEVFTQVCDGLEHAHGKGIVHRDIKPANIMLSKRDSGDWNVSILDFGIAKLIEDFADVDVLDQQDSSDDLQRGFRTQTGAFLGSPLYASPEQIRGEEVSARSDMYSLGCVMFASLVGRPPFVGATVFDTISMHLNSEPPLEILHEKKIPEELCGLIERLLAKEAEHRLAHVSEIRQALLSAQNKQQPQTDPDQSAQSKQRPQIDPDQSGSSQGVSFAHRIHQLLFEAKNFPMPLMFVAVIGLVVVLVGMPILFSSGEDRQSITSRARKDNISTGKVKILPLQGQKLNLSGVSKEQALNSLRHYTGTLQQAETIEDVDLSFVEGAPEAINYIRHFPNLKTLSLDEESVTQPTIELLSEVKSLESVHFPKATGSINDDVIWTMMRLMPRCSFPEYEGRVINNRLQVINQLHDDAKIYAACKPAIEIIRNRTGTPSYKWLPKFLLPAIASSAALNKQSEMRTFLEQICEFQLPEPVASAVAERISQLAQLEREKRGIKECLLVYNEYCFSRFSAKNGDGPGMARLLADYSAFLMLIEDFRDAEKNLEQSMRLLEECRSKTDTSDLYGPVYFVLGRLLATQHDFKRARPALLEANQHLSKTTDSKYLLELYSCNVELLLPLDEWAGDRKAARNDLERAGEAAEKLRSSALLKIVKFQKKRLDDSRQPGGDRMKSSKNPLLKELQLPVSQARSWDMGVQLSEPWHALDDPLHRREVFQQYQQALDSFALKNEDTIGAAWLLERQAEIELVEGNPAEAKEKLQKVLSIVKRHGDDLKKLSPTLAGTTLIRLGHAEMFLKNFKNVEMYCADGLAALGPYRDENSVSLKCQAYIWLSDIKKRECKWAAAREYLQSALNPGRQGHLQWAEPLVKLKMYNLDVTQTLSR